MNFYISAILHDKIFLFYAFLILNKKKLLEVIVKPKLIIKKRIIHFTCWNCQLQIFKWINRFPLLEQHIRITKSFEEMLVKRLSMHDRSVYHDIFIFLFIGLQRKATVYGNWKWKIVVADEVFQGSQINHYVC